MLTYQEYFAQQKRTENAANNVSLSEFKAPNLTGLTEKESVQLLAGRYFGSIAQFADPANLSSQVACLADAVAALIFAIRYTDAGDVNLGLHEPDEIEEVDIVIFDEQINDFCRMRPMIFLGSIVSFCDIRIEEKYDLYLWACMQLDMIGKYCITHNIDLVYVINSIPT